MLALHALRRQCPWANLPSFGMFSHEIHNTHIKVRQVRWVKVTYVANTAVRSFAPMSRLGK